MTTPTEQTPETMRTNFAVLIGVAHEKKWFKPIGDKKDNDFYVYRVINGLHYYVTFNLYEKRIGYYNLMRTNHKMVDIRYTNVNEDPMDYDWEVDQTVHNYMQNKMWEEQEGYINERASWYCDIKNGDNGVDGFRYGSRYEKGKQYDHQSRDYTDAEIEIIKQLDITKLPAGFLTKSYSRGENIDLWYYAPHLPSITEEHYDNTIESILKNAIKDVVVKNTKININCIDAILEYL